MQPAIRDLAKLPDTDFFASIAEGLPLILANAGELYAAACATGTAGHQRAARILEAIAEEEAAKCLILLDAVRCPRNPARRLRVHLERFYEHLAKGLYARACLARPRNLGELQSFVDLHRAGYYLDGFFGTEYLFRNEVLQEREGAIYVDYVDTGDDHRWSAPSRHLFEERSFSPLEPLALRMSRFLADCGFMTAEALAILAAVWRPIALDAETTYGEISRLNITTLNELERAGLLLSQTDHIYSCIAHDWLFPMYGLDLTMIRTDLDALREQQRAGPPVDEW